MSKQYRIPRIHRSQHPKTRSRRDILRFASVAGATLFSNQVLNVQETIGEQAMIPEGLEVRDYRLFPTPDRMRFIVEVFNATDEPIDTPTLGVVVPQLPPDQNYGWASPMHGVVHPNSSSGLIGVAPKGLSKDEDWGNPDWILCDKPQTRLAKRIEPFDVTLEASLEPRAGSDLVVHLKIANTGVPLDSTVTILGMVRDAEHRFCGGTYPIGLQSIKPGEEGEFTLWLGSYTNILASHSVLVDNSEDLSVEFSVQPFLNSINTGCAPVMPWNRE